LPEGFDKENRKYRHVIDKMGTVGTLMVGDTFVDIMDSQDYYDEKELTAPSKGYFVINPLVNAAGNYRIMLSNMALITSEMDDYKEGDITVPSTELTGTRDSFELVFSDAVELAAASVKTHIFVSKDKDGEKADVEYDYVINGDTITITPDDGLDYDTVYYVTVKAGFGYNAYTVKSDVEATYMYESLKGDLTVTDVYAGYRDVYLTFNGDIEQITIADFKDKVKIEFNGEELLYNVKINGNRAIISLDRELEAGKIYDISVLAGLGYEMVTVKEDKKNYFTLEEIYSTDFANFPADKSSAVLFTASSYDPKQITQPYKTVRNGKLFTQTNCYSTLHFNKMGIENLERYSLKIEDVQYFGNDVKMMLYFNVNSTSGGIFSGQGGKPITGFGWHTTSTEKQMRDFLAKGIKNGPSNDSTIHTAAENPVTIQVASEQDVTFAAEANDADVTVPESNGISYTYTLDKIGTLGRLYINGTFVDAYETADTFEKWNKISGTGNQITADIPEKGYIMMGFNEASENKYTVALGDITIAVYKEYKEGGVKIAQDDVIISGNTANGSIKVRNYFANDTKKVAVVVAAYGENNKFLGVKKVIDTQLSPSEIASASYNFSAAEEIREVKAELIDETSIAYTDEVSVTSALQSDFENNVITVKGKIKEKDSDRKLLMLLSKNNQLEVWNDTNAAEGNFTVVDIPANASDFEYSFNYKDLADVDPYQMSIYAVVWENGIKANKLAAYNYARNEDVLIFVEKAKTNKITFSEITQYAQSLGIDLAFADTSYKQDVLVETIYSERETISGVGSLTSIMSKAKARADLLSSLKNEGTSIAKVDEIITTYAVEAGLALTYYNSLSDKQKILVCTNFVKADYEELGFVKFTEEFNKAIENAKITTPPTTGGGGGGGGGGGYVQPSIPETSGKEYTQTESTAKDAVEIIGGKQGFSDMAEYAWAEAAVKALSDDGVITGIGNNMFNPEGIVTREQIAKMIVSAFNVLDNDAIAEYDDVDTAGWAYRFIASAKKTGLMNGFSDTEFAPLSAVTREDLCVILYRATVRKGTKYNTKKSDFTDFADISDYAVDSVEYMAGAGIVNGFEDGTFDPKAPATRAQAAVLIYNALTGGGSK
ncbi:MAG: S-layer homology domain-containing protein, partial [Clostridia bacterium]|nr:S-layer homology domain-containing protein [Clostridia bacterium]